MLHVSLSAETACSPGKASERFRSSEQRGAALHQGTALGITVGCVCAAPTPPRVTLRVPGGVPLPPPRHNPAPSASRIRREVQASPGVSALLGATALPSVLVKHAWPRPRS